ncbi:hypothetical protein [Mesotoga sp.]|uniref:hypothetical protein n=1 Tax=Mesotoga sp. TaxID=2053577 RepID=UPI00345EBB97
MSKLKRSLATAILITVLAISCLSRNPTVETYRNLFHSVTYLDIENFSVNLTTDKINISRNEKRMLLDGDILIYLTDEGRLGKMLILQLDRDQDGFMYFDFVTYDREGKISIEKQYVKLQASFIYDFDKGMIPEKIEGVKIWWHSLDDLEMYLVPWTPTKLGKYPVAKMN